MKKSVYLLIIIFLGVISMSSCTKVEKAAPNSFTEKTTWQVTEISIGGDKIPSLPIWEISSTESSVWCHDGGTCSNFYWSFSKNKNYFEFYVDKKDPENKINQAFKQCDNLAGKYYIMTSKKNLYEFETNETNGYVGPRVYIRIE